MKLSISTNFPQVQRQLEAMQQDIANRAVSSALNKVAAQAKTAMSREIRSEFNIGTSIVNQSLRIRRASARRGRFELEAELSSISRSGRRSLNLARFAPRKTRLGVTVKIRRRGPRTLIRGAFLINGGATVMIRSGAARLPIEARQTIDVPQMFNTRRLNDRVVSLILAKFPAIFANEARFFTERFNRGAL